MHALRFRPAVDDPASALGAVLAHSVYAPGDRRRPIFKKGHRLTAADLPRLGAGEAAEVHLVALDPGDVAEDEASVRLAELAAGPGVERRPPVESQVRLQARWRGVLRVATEALTGLNCVEDVSVYTLFDGQIVDTGQVVGAAKVTPLAIPRARLDEAEAVRARHGPAVDVAPFQPHRVAALTRERLDTRGRQKFEAVLRHKLAWLGSELTDIRDAQGDAAAARRVLAATLASGAEVALVGGVTSLDPLDPMAAAIAELDGRFVRRGMPAHPGSTYWLAYVGEVPVVGVASCGLFSEATFLDLLLPRLLTGERPEARDLAALGHGGLLGKGMAFRFPAYGEPAAE